MDLSLIPLHLLSFFWVFFISSTLILQDGQHKEPQQQQQRGQQWREQLECQPAATPPPTLEQVWVMQAQMLQTMQ
jgi:hypothetical protein